MQISKTEKSKFRISPKDLKKGERLLKKFVLFTQQFICINPGAGQNNPGWPPQNFAQAADQLFRLGQKVVFIGSKKDRAACKEVARFMMHPSINLAGLASLGEAATLLLQGKLLITGDPDFFRIASAIKVPSVAIASKAFDKDRNASLNGKFRQAVLSPRATVENVLQAAADILRQKILKPVKMALQPSFPGHVKKLYVAGKERAG